MADLTGDSGDNSIAGTTGNDLIDFSQGGEDTVTADAGDDTLLVGGALDAGDRIDGGEGTADTLVLDGDYWGGLVFTDATVTDVEFISLTGGHDYDLTLADGTAVVQGRSQVWIYGTDLAADDRVRIDGSAIAAGHGLFALLGPASGTVTGGAGDDILDVRGESTVTFSGNDGDDAVDSLRALTRADHLTGGAGADQLILEVGQTTVFTGKMAKGFETLILVGGSFDLTMADANVGFGQVMAVRAQNLQPGQHLVFDASAERSGAYDVGAGQDADTVIGGRGGDNLRGAGGDDILTGGRGGDVLSGGAGADTFVYDSTKDSGAHKQFDLISDLEASDHIDLSAIDANPKKDGDQAFHLVEAFTHHVGELVLSYDAGAGFTTLAGDVDGDGKADIAIHIAGDHADFSGVVL